MDYSKFRRSTNIDDDTNNPMSGIYKKMAQYGLPSPDQVGGALGDIASGFNPVSSAGAGEQDVQPGGLADQMGINSVYDSTGNQNNAPDDNPYNAQTDPQQYEDQGTGDYGGFETGEDMTPTGIDYPIGFADGGAVDDDNDADTENDNDADDPLSGALNTIDSIMMHGYKKNGLLGGGQPQGATPDPTGGGGFAKGGAVRYADGGAIADPDEEQDTPDTPQTPPSDPSGYQGGIPSMDQLRSAAGSIPSPAAPFEQPMRRILNLIQGGDAMPIDQSQQLEHQSGEADPNIAKIKTAATLAKTAGPDTAWSYLQSLRKQYDLNRTNAAVKASQGNIPQSTIAATHAMTNVLDGTSTRFTPVRGGVHVSVRKIGGGGGGFSRGGSVGYADGGAVDDQQAIPTDANGNDASPEQQPEQSQAMISDATLSIPQYLALLRGKIGQYDQVWNNGIASAIKQAASGLVGNGPGPDTANHQFPTPPQASAALGEGAEGGAPLGVQNENGQIGSEEEIPNEQKRVVPMPPSRPPQAAATDNAAPPAVPTPAGAAATSTPPAAPKNESTYEKLVRLYGADEVQRAQAAFPAASQSGQMMQYLNQQAAEKQKHTYDMEKTNAIWGNRVLIAGEHDKTRLSVEQMKGMVADRNQAAITARAIQVAAQRSKDTNDIVRGRLFASFVNSGQVPPPEFLNWGTNLLNKDQGQVAPQAAQQPQEPQAQGPVVVRQGENPNANQPAGPRTMLINNKPYYVDAGGKVLGPAQ